MVSIWNYRIKGDPTIFEIRLEFPASKIRREQELMLKKILERHNLGASMLWNIITTKVQRYNA